MHLFMAAVIAGDDYGCAGLIEHRQDLTDSAVGIADRLEVGFGHPPEVVPCDVGVSQVYEGKATFPLFRQMLGCSAPYLKI